MDTQGKSNAEFRNDVNEALARHESRFDQVTHALQQVLMEIQALCVTNSPRRSLQEINPFAMGESSNTHATYQEVFERLSHQVDGLPENFLIGCFIARLRDEIRLELKIKHLTTLAEIIGVARLIEEKIKFQCRSTPNYRPPVTSVTTKVTTSPNSGVLEPPLNARDRVNTPTKTPMVRRISIKKPAKEGRKDSAIIVMTNSFRAIDANDHNFS
ncbi:hypothetical protein FEM48_Zijuj01G0202100 [Ziziphus jujuba var. spinosa]|uniref:Uncharacterized protein n=1 Tax=Ziziphus jujuba var. spinosa TaxID=714518 RepID=A0A978W3B6_ZIZJJ|nr:hypothetical protein FEM48_Zijuj01G0202100 [Ziziphus jujuba var. spinosa]